MKKYLTLSAIISFFYVTANSQTPTKLPPNPPSENSYSGRDMSLQKNNKKQKMKELGLSKNQKGELKQFHKTMKQQKQTIESDASLNDQQKKEKLKQLKKEKQNKLNTVLTPEQKQKMMQENKPQPTPKRGVTNLPNEKTGK